MFTNVTSQLHSPADPTTSAPWAHDMHEAVTEPPPPRAARHLLDDEGPPNGNGFIPTCPPNSTPINRTLSTEKHVGNLPVRVFIPEAGIKIPSVYSGVALKQYTKLPDHRPPLRRDKPVRISLPDHPPRYVFPAVDRSFIFIPRAMRPNQQRVRGKPRSGLGSIGGFSRRTSVFGGSYYGSQYSPSIAMSRRSSLAPDGRDYMFSPTGSVISRPPLPEAPRPVVRLPPPSRHDQQGPPSAPFSPIERQLVVAEPSINDLPPPQTHPLPQKPAFQENRPNSSLTMHQPRPQKAVSVEHIESPTLSQHNQPYHGAFHQQVPVHVSNGYPQDAHSRQPSYPSQHSTGTPLSQIPERAIHAAPFQPTTFSQQNFYGHQPYQMLQPQQGYYFPASFSGGGMAPPTAPPTFVPATQQSQTPSFNHQPQPEQPSGQPNGQAGGNGPNLVAQEVNGMVYYYDASQLPAVSAFPAYPPTQGFVPGVVGMGGVPTPGPDGFFYQQPNPGMVYYSQ
jgi:hypothetical protein